jgi:hypothetical protein
MPLTLKEINSELAKRGHNTLLQKGSGYFYFRGGDWLDRTVRVRKVSSLTLEQWIGKFERFNGALLLTQAVGAWTPWCETHTARF